MKEELSTKINILFVIIQMEMGGSERLVCDLALRLDRALFNPSIAWFHGDEVLREFYDLEIPLYHIPKIKRFDISTMQKLGEIIRHNNIHIVNAHHFMPMVYSYYGCKIINYRKLICTIHSEWEIELIPWKWKKVGHYLLKHSDGVVGVSKNISTTIRDRFKLYPSNIFTIQNGVDLEAFTHCNNRAELRKMLGLADNERVIGIVANLKKIKNHIFLVKAFNELIKNNKYVKLLIVGQGFKDDPENTEEDLRFFVNKERLDRNVLFLGYRSDIANLLSVMDIFCLTSLREGLPLSLIEAMAAGLPVVGTAVNGIEDVIIPNKNGFLVDIDDIEGLKEVLHLLLRDEMLRKKFGEESRSIAINTYPLSNCINKYQEMFLSVTKK